MWVPFYSCHWTNLPQRGSEASWDRLLPMTTTKWSRGVKFPMRLLLSPCRRRQPSVLQHAAVIAWCKITITQHYCSHPPAPCFWLPIFWGKCHGRFWKGCFSLARNKVSSFSSRLLFCWSFSILLLNFFDKLFLVGHLCLILETRFCCCSHNTFSDWAKIWQFLSFFCNGLALSHLFGRKPCSCPRVRVLHCHHSEERVPLWIWSFYQHADGISALSSVLFSCLLQMVCGFFVFPVTQSMRLTTYQSQAHS